MEAGRESAKRMRAAMTATSEGSAGGSSKAEEEQQLLVGSEETEEHIQIQRILLAIDNFTRQVSEMLEAGRALFKDLATDLEDRLCSIQKERVERWEEEIRELRARDAANQQARALLHNAQLHLLQHTTTISD